ncbi:hypothetical protein RDWZM_006814 [Blomia tropicalis]|uniref:Ribonuclease P protein subunit p29 n=1 Tax=Blomia tropicalis TaxID=40697 RepID=A0A9Q0M8I2_BLOTA|nr:hypothetical protein RDWZM_006814 [Blomia tropicalis]
MDPKFSSSSALFKTLPPEITDVAHLINVEPGIEQSEDIFKTFVQDRIPRKDIGEDFKYKVYSLYETIDENKPKGGKNIRNKKPTKRLNCRQKKALFDIRKDNLSYKDFATLNQLWHSYFQSILSEVKTQADELKLSRADYHGAFLMVYASQNPTVIGLQGYVVQESKNTFRLINSNNRLLSKSF